MCPLSIVRPAASTRAWALWLSTAALLVVSACGGDEPPPDTRSGSEATRSVALAASRSGELTRYVQDLLRARTRQGGADSGAVAAPGAAPAIGSTVAAPSASSAPVRSSTLVQEAGVDEADLLKTDGTHLYSLNPGNGSTPKLQSHRRAADGSVTLHATLELSADGSYDATTTGLLLASDDRSGVVIGQRWTPVRGEDLCAGACPPSLAPTIAPYWFKSSVELQSFALSGGVPSARDRLRIDGHLVDSRRVGDRLVLVSVHRPLLPPDLLPASAGAAEREAAIAGLTAADILPRLRVNDGPASPLVADTECWTQSGNGSLVVEITTVTVLDLASPTLARTSRCFVGGTEALYMTPDTLYLATTRWSYASSPIGWLYPADMRTDIHKFALGTTPAAGVSYRGSGEVAGHLGWNTERKSLRLSEHAGVLRVLSFTGTLGWIDPADAMNPGARPPSPATLTLLRESAGRAALEVVSTLPNTRRPAPLGKPGEQVYGVRFVGDRGYVVTFRVIDPLYVLDLADPADPRVAGVLELPGFSDHLVPLADGLLFGVGRDVAADGRLGGVKVALLDVSRPDAPREIAHQVFGGASSMSALDASRHGLNLLERDGAMRLALPLAVGDGSWQRWTAGLQRFEVDTRARTLAVRPMVGARVEATWPEMVLQRSLQIGDHVYYLRGGELTAHAW